MFQFNEDFVVKMQYYAISQLRQNPDYVNFCKLIGDDYNNLKKVSEYILSSLDIDSASGIWLDYIGWLVGTTREYFNISRYFSVNFLDVNVDKYIWFTDQLINTDNLSDELFKKRIYAKIGYNISIGTRNENIYIIKNMTNAAHVQIKRVAPMTLDLTLIGNQIIMTQNFIDDVNDILGNGVGIRDLTILGEDE